MICSICNKNEAVIHFKGVFNEQVIEMDICEECARKKGMEFKCSDQFSDFVSTLMDLDAAEGSQEGAQKAKGEKRTAVCPSCGLTYSEFKRTGRLGCAGCYRAFSFRLANLLEKIHGKTRHTGKNPEKTKTSGNIGQKYALKQELEKALKSEQYEKAASLRDRINKLKE